MEINEFEFVILIFTSSVLTIFCYNDKNKRSAGRRKNTSKTVFVEDIPLCC
jgi:hypothetical protein